MDSGLSEYRQVIGALFARTGGTSKYGLARTLALLELLGNPHLRLRTFHVAGTNGKGSVVASLYALLRDKGMHVGRYTSPHLTDFRERIVVDDQKISEAYVVAFLSEWGLKAEKIGATFFEITTALAFDYFARKGVDVAVIEAGLGGRLDATNVITPLSAGITSISIDHSEILGETAAEIAREKAGIFKAGVPSVIGPMDTEARVAIYGTASELGADAVVDATRLYSTHDVSVSESGTSFFVEHAGKRANLSTGLVGLPQAANASVALAMLWAAGNPYTTPLEDAATVLPHVTLAGRFQRLGPHILDVAHNPDGMRALARTVRAVNPPRPVVAVVGILADKKWREMLDVLSEVVDEMILTMPGSAPTDRAWSAADAQSYADQRGIPARSEVDLGRALMTARSTGATVLITGSFHTVGDAMQILGFEP
ncbi:MAG: bifunctional folylpolyglutamate synthase/dihydrofolate synthase [Gemmatimonadota bacterium]|nr:bifunctional folylpolyglutamate synthase/dihydrofolate synthase [Gemmatimonadota bacterium]